MPNPDGTLTKEERDALFNEERGAEQQRGKQGQTVLELPEKDKIWLQKVGVNSPEAQLWRLNNPKYEEILQGADWNAKPITLPRIALQLLVDYGPSYKEYLGKKGYAAETTAILQEQYLNAHPGLKRVLSLVTAYELGLPEDMGELYWHWYEHEHEVKPEDTYKAERLLQEHPDFYQTLLRTGIIQTPVDFTKVPSVDLLDRFNRWKRIRDSVESQKALIDDAELHNFVTAKEPSYKDIDVVEIEKTIAERKKAADQEAFAASEGYKYYKTLVGDYQKAWFKMANPEWHKAAVEAGYIPNIDITDVPTEEVWKQYRRHITIPDEASKLKDLRQNRKLYDWMVQTGKVKPLTPGELAEPPAQYTQYIKELVREKTLGMKPQVSGGRMTGFYPFVPTGQTRTLLPSEALLYQNPELEDYRVNVLGQERRHHFVETPIAAPIWPGEVPEEHRGFYAAWSNAKDEAFKRQLETQYPEAADWLRKRLTPSPARVPAYSEFATPEQKEAEQNRLSAAQKYRNIGIRAAETGYKIGAPAGIEGLPPGYGTFYGELMNLPDEQQKWLYLDKYPDFKKAILGNKGLMAKAGLYKPSQPATTIIRR